MSLKDKAMNRMLGGVTSKAMKGLVPLLESIHTYLELQAALQEQILKTNLVQYGMNTEEANDEITKIKNKIVADPQKSSDDPNSTP